MNQQRIPEELLQKTDKILFITHLAIGDYTYLQTYFKAFAEKYPHIKIDIWVDELRRTWRWWQWKHLKRYVLYDWLAATPFINKIYRETYSPIGYKLSIKQAQQEQYPIVVSFASLRVASYIDLARKIAPGAVIASFNQKLPWYRWGQRRNLLKGNIFIEKKLPVGATPTHITDHYAWWFKQLFNIDVLPEDRRPFVALPKPWIIASKLKFLKYGIDKRTKPFGKIYFINAYAKNGKRSWPIEKVMALIRMLKQDDTFNDVTFLINVVPEVYDNPCSCLKEQLPNNTIVFCARDNFFQLPATLALCDLIISVETAVMHLACAVNVPVIALMRQKNPEWAPWDHEHSYVITTEKRSDWIKDIAIDAVVKKIKEVQG